MTAPPRTPRTDIERLLAVARGDLPADLVLRNARIVDLLGGRVRKGDVAIACGRIAGLGRGRKGAATRDLGGRFLAPGLIDAHVHVESALVPPAEFARAVVPHGVTTAVTDPHEIANVSGIPGIRYMLASAATVPLEMFVNAPSCVPASGLATSGARLDPADLAALHGEPRLLGLAEVMDYPGVVGADPAVLAKLAAFRGRVIDGHCPGVSGRALDAYVAAGISSDHESTSAAEAREKLSRGLTIFIREATNARNLEALLPLLNRWTERYLCFCTDDRQPADLLDEGSVDHLVRAAIRLGAPPIAALRLGSLNPAEHDRLTDRGAIAPGRRADLFSFSDLAEPRAEEVWIGGELAAAGGEPLFAGGSPAPPEILDTVRVGPIELAVPAAGRRVRAIGVVPDQLLTESLVVEAAIRDGLAVADPSRDLLKIAVVERHGGSGPAAVGFVQGVGLARGAISGTFAHDHHNLIVIGADDASMLAAARAVIASHGGLAAADGDHLLAHLPLPIAGLMSDRPIAEVRRATDALIAAARGLGSRLHDPYMAMSFLGLEVIPKLKITDRGLVDVERFEIVGVWAE